MIHKILIYAGGPSILLAGVLLGMLIEKYNEKLRKTKDYDRRQAALPRATKRVC